MRRFVFLDRDGTLIVEKDYLRDPEAVELTPGAAPALRRLRDANFGIAVVTNQSGIGRGYFSTSRLASIHERLQNLLAAEGASIDALYVCPHAPEDACPCRKPGIALIEQAVREHEADRTGSFMIGDKESDIRCGENAGLTTILVRTGYGASIENNIGERVAFVAADLAEAVDFILGVSKCESRHTDAGVFPLSSGLIPMMTREICAYLEESALVIGGLAKACDESIARSAEILIEAFGSGRKLLLCGNGGSAADCQHLATEFVSRFSSRLERPPLPALALTTDTSFLTAFSNDCGYEGVFERQIRAFGQSGDVLLAISTSGNSPNVLAAARAARTLGLTVIALTGPAGALSGLADVAIAVPTADTQHMQEAHIAVEHLLCGLVERALYMDDGSNP